MTEQETTYEQYQRLLLRPETFSDEALAIYAQAFDFGAPGDTIVNALVRRILAKPAAEISATDWEASIIDAKHSAATEIGALTSTVAAAGIEIVRAIRETLGVDVPVPEQIVEALVPATAPEILTLARQHPIHREWLEPLAKIREEMDS